MCSQLTREKSKEAMKHGEVKKIEKSRRKFTMVFKILKWISEKVKRFFSERYFSRIDIILKIINPWFLLSKIILEKIIFDGIAVLECDNIWYRWSKAKIIIEKLLIINLKNFTLERVNFIPDNIFGK